MMARYNTRSAGVTKKPSQVGPMGVQNSTASPTATTFEGARAWVRNARTDLFLRSTSSFAGQSSFYEDGTVRDQRLVELVRGLAVDDWDWTAKFLTWLRAEGNMRTAPILLAAEAVDARLKAKDFGTSGSEISNRQLISNVLLRADEPGELLAYWLQTHGRAIPQPIKRGIADAVARLYTERGFLRYDSSASGVRFGDVIELTHPKVAYDKANYQGHLYRWAISARHNRTEEPPEQLRAITARRRLNALSPAAKRELIEKATFEMPVPLQRAIAGQWEWLKSWAGSDVDNRLIWELLVPEMGYMALLRNLRNLDQAGVSNETIDYVVKKLSDPEEVAKSRQLPFRFYSAYLNAPSDNWKLALSRGLQASLNNVPKLNGRTLILVDTSGSMRSTISQQSSVQCVQQAMVFGVALAHANQGNVDLWGWASGQFKHDIPRGASVLAEVQRMDRLVGTVGMGTEMAAAVQRGYQGHDRVIILSDMQAFPAGGRYGGYGYGYQTVGESVPAHVPIYCFNLAGYSNTPFQTGSATRVDLGGMTDHTFSLIPQLENLGRGTWPWEKG